MNNLVWLEFIATRTDFDIEIDKILKQQSSAIQMAYQFNDSTTLKNILGKTDKLACRNTIFQY